VIVSHHERYDGSGYPSGMMGEEIPVGARVLAIADVYDVLTLPSYETGSHTSGEVLEIMEKEMHGKFDPEMFKHFKKMILERLILLEGTEFHPQTYIGIWGTGTGKKKAG